MINQHKIHRLGSRFRESGRGVKWGVWCTLSRMHATCIWTGNITLE